MKNLLFLMTQLSAFASVIYTETPDRSHFSGSSNLSCYTCSTIDDIRCKVINETNLMSRYSAYNTRLYGSECSSGEHFCAVLRLDAKIDQYTVDYKFWAIERKCANDCTDGCFVLVGERTKLSLCTTCCSTDYCNIGNASNSFSCSNTLLCLFFVLCLYCKKSKITL